MSEEKTMAEPTAETIEEAKQQVQESPKEAISLKDRLAKVTEQKSFTRPEPKKENKSAVDNNSAYGFLGSDDDFDTEPDPISPEPAENESEEESHPDKPKKSKGGITDKAKRSSARTAVGMIDLFQRGVFTPIQNWKFGRKWTKEQKERLLDIEDAALNDLEDKEDRLLKARWDRMLKKHTKKIEKIPFSETERNDMEEAFYQYFDFKEKTLPPEWFVAMAVAKSIGDRTVDLITD